MNFRREEIKEYYLLDTDVENIFINEYMASAPGDFVKVYLFALMYAGVRESLDNDMIARQLSMKVEDVEKAWAYWESMGVIRKERKNAAAEGRSRRTGTQRIFCRIKRSRACINQLKESQGER